jgi:hypothetical protein
MAKKRRKIDKVRAQKHLKKRVFKQEPASKTQTDFKKQPLIEKKRIEGLFKYDPLLIAKDLKKTLLITLVVLLVLALISLRYT